MPTEKLFTIAIWALRVTVFSGKLYPMKATKAHYEFTAALINAAANGVNPRHLVTLAIAKFAKDNPLFDEERFKAACNKSMTARDERLQS